MQDEIFQKKDIAGCTKTKIPYYRFKDNRWVIEQVEHSVQYTLKQTIGYEASEPKVEPKRVTRERPYGRMAGGMANETDYLTWLSEIGDSTIWKHPRTNERLDMVSESNGLTKRLYDKKHYEGLPRITYHRELNRTQGIKLIVVEESGERFVEPESLSIGKRTKQWKGVWNMTKRGTPRKFNFLCGGKYNFGDQSIIKQQVLTERCNFLAKQIVQRGK